MNKNYVCTALLGVLLPLSAFGEFESNPLARTGRFTRGSGEDPTTQSFVVPVDFQTGVELAPTGNNADKFGNTAVLPWFSQLQPAPVYHINVSGSANAQTYAYDLAVTNPVAAFGSAAGGSPLYTGQEYSFVVYAGGQLRNNAPEQPNSDLNGDFFVEIYPKGMFTPGGTDGFYYYIATLPKKNTAGWDEFISQGGEREFDVGQELSHNGQPLACKIRIKYVEGSTTDQTMGTRFVGAFIVTVKAETSDFYWLIKAAGQTIYTTNNNTYAQWMCVSDPDNPNTVVWEPLLALNFDEHPAWRATYIDQPHFAGKAIPPAYQGKSLAELLQVSNPVSKQFAAPGNDYLTAGNNSPELQTHPLLDKFVADLGNDPLALVNYVLNEIELTDALSYNTDGSVSEESINLGGVNRSALATYLEGQGSPAEQNALLVYLLRKAGVHASYVYPPKNGLLMLDERMGKLLRMQLHGAVDEKGQTYVP
ncbi:MAG: hypothetical protein LBK60_05290, partial [Verrucomicrobiales bacterium]|nr:hypothetical protein [Verrucomicrobiales bacterium]